MSSNTGRKILKRVSASTPVDQAAKKAHSSSGAALTNEVFELVMDILTATHGTPNLSKAIRGTVVAVATPHSTTSNVPASLWLADDGCCCRVVVWDREHPMLAVVEQKIGQVVRMFPFEFCAPYDKVVQSVVKYLPERDLSALPNTVTKQIHEDMQETQYMPIHVVASLPAYSQVNMAVRVVAVPNHLQTTQVHSRSVKHLDVEVEDVSGHRFHVTFWAAKAEQALELLLEGHFLFLYNAFVSLFNHHPQVSVSDALPDTKAIRNFNISFEVQDPKNNEAIGIWEAVQASFVKNLERYPILNEWVSYISATSIGPDAPKMGLGVADQELHRLISEVQATHLDVQATHQEVAEVHKQGDTIIAKLDALET